MGQRSGPKVGVDLFDDGVATVGGLGLRHLQRGVGEDRVVTVGRKQLTLLTLIGRDGCAVEAFDPAHVQPPVDVLGFRPGGERGERDLGDLRIGDQRLILLVPDRVRVVDRGPRRLLDAGDRAQHSGVHPGGDNPMAVARYRERRTVARAKSDHADAMTLANILRTDAAGHRPLPADTELVQAIAVLARAQQDAVWNRARLSNQLRSHLKQYYPAALAAFQVKGVGLDSREARAVLAAAPEPAARLSAARLRSVLRKAGRQRYIDSWVERLRPIFAAEQLHQLPAVEQAMGRQTLALVSQLDAACRAADELAEAAAAAFAAHPDAEILTSFPGIGPVTGARVLAEIGDDRARFRDARGLRPMPVRRRSPSPAARASSCATAR